MQLVEFSIGESIFTAVEACFLRDEVLGEDYWEFIERGVFEVEVYD